MSDKLVSKIKELEEKVRLLEIENSDWTDRAEDVFLFATTAESISELTVEKEIFEVALEKISIMKNIPYCAFGTIGNGVVNIEYEYASFSEEEKIANIILSKSLKNTVLSKKIIVEKYDKSNPNIEIKFKEKTFNPENILIISFSNSRNKDGIFICIDNGKEDRFDLIRDTLNHSVTLVNNRIDNLYLMHRLVEQNENLEMKVDERTGELEEEIKGHILTEEALKESEENFRYLMEQSPFVIELYNLDGLQVLVNKAYEELWGFPAERTVNKFNVLKSKEVADTGLLDYVKRAYNGESVDVPEYVFDSTGSTEANGVGRVRWLSTRIYPIKEKTGKVKNIVITHQDVSKRKYAEKEIVKSKEKAENADKMKSIFLAQMSHEIRTPINAFVSMASLLRYDFEETASNDQLMSFDIIDRAGERIIRTIDLLLNLSEIQAGTYEVNLTKFDIFAEVISLIVAENKMVAKKKNIKLNLIYSVQNSEIVADHYTVNQIFAQLVDNAIKYTNEGEVIVKILRNELEQLVVEVKDTGIGIDKNYLPKIFDAFSQEEMGYTRKYEGNGIGLTLVKTYCELNKAFIEVESTKCVGSVFRVIFNA